MRFSKESAPEKIRRSDMEECSDIDSGNEEKHNKHVAAVSTRT